METTAQTHMNGTKGLRHEDRTGNPLVVRRSLYEYWHLSIRGWTMGKLTTRKRKAKSNKGTHDDTSFVRIDADPIEHRDTGPGIGWKPQPVGNKLFAPRRLTRDLANIIGISKWRPDDD